MVDDPIDLVREHPVYYAAKPKPAEIELGTIPFLTLEGEGDPDGETYRTAVEAVRVLAEAVRPAASEGHPDFEVPPVETIWWTDPGKPEAELDVADWMFKVLVRMPGFVHRDIVDEARRQAQEAGLGDTGLEEHVLDEVRFETLGEGPCVQVLHEGPYDEVHDAYERIHAFLDEHELAPGGPAHEIYLDEPGRSDAEQMRTIVRLPVRPVGG